MRMQYPSSEDVRSYPSGFEVAHSEARHKGFDGSLVLRSEDGDGVVVYRDGLPIYAHAMYQDGDDVCGSGAVEALKLRSGTVDRRPSDEESIRMFCTYMEYLGRENSLMRVYEKDEVEVGEREFVVTKGGDLTKVDVPGGVRVGYSRSLEEVSKYFENESADGYAVSNDAVVRFGNGHETESKVLKDDGEPLLARMESEKGLNEIDCEFERVFPERGTGTRKIDVEFDIKGWEVVRTDGKEESGGILNRFLG
jgi:hypothetical protein